MAKKILIFKIDFFATLQSTYRKTGIVKNSNKYKVCNANKLKIKTDKFADSFILSPKNIRQAGRNTFNYNTPK